MPVSTFRQNMHCTFYPGLVRDIWIITRVLYDRNRTTVPIDRCFRDGDRESAAYRQRDVHLIYRVMTCQTKYPRFGPGGRCRAGCKALTQVFFCHN